MMKSASPLSRKVVGNATWCGLARLTAIAANVLTVPVYLRGLGPEQYGVFVLIQSLLGVTGILNLGVGDATVMFMADSLGRGRLGEAVRYFRSGLLVQLIVGGLGFILCVGVAPSVFRVLLQLEPEMASLVTSSLTWFGAAWLLRNVAAAFFNVCIAHQRYDIVTSIREGATVFERIAGMAAVLGGGSLVRIYQTQVVVQFLAVVIVFFVSKAQMPDLKVTPQLDRAALRSTIRIGTWQSITSVTSELSYTLDRWLVGLLISKEAVGYFGAVQTVVTSLYGAVGSLCAVLFPTFTELYARESQERATRIFVSGTWVLTHIAAAAFIPLFICAKPFLVLWLGTQAAGQSVTLLRVLIVAQLAMAPSLISNVFLAGVGKTRWNAVMGSLSLVGGFLANCLLIALLGPVGVGWSRFLQGLIWSVGLILMRGAFFREMPATWYVGGVFGTTLSALGFVILVVPFHRFLDEMKVGGIVGLLALCVACALAVLFLLMLVGRFIPGSRSRHLMLMNMVAAMKSA